MIDDSNRITLVLVDTCAFRDANSDFLGISKMLLPAFFQTVEEKGIVLLTHPVLENEIKKHIEDSSLYREHQILLAQLRKCNETLKRFECGDDDLFSKISELAIQDKLFDAYQHHYQNAVRLGFGDPSTVFALYFDGKPPFTVSGKKKNEFPDAFVFDATRQHMERHPNDILLVVSKDNDWKTAFEAMDNVVICKSVSDAQTMISHIDSILSQEMVGQIFHGAYQEMVKDAQLRIECECFELSDYETITELEIETVKIESISDAFTPLKITRDSLWLSTDVKVKVSGHAEVFDEDSSFWDSVDNEYLFTVYAEVNFTDAEVEVECEVLISFDFDDPENTAQVVSFKLLNPGNICIDCRDATVCQISEDEMAMRALREDKGYPRRGIN